MTLVIIDDWISSDSIDLQVDGTSKPFLTSIGDSTTWAADFCGDAGFKDLGAISVKSKVFHTASSINIKLQGSVRFDSTRTSWGIRELILSFGTKDVAEIEESCGYSNAASLLSNNCNCPDG